MPQAPVVTFVDNAGTTITLTPMGLENGWTNWRQTVPMGDTPMDGFIMYARCKNPPSNTKDPKASRRAEFKAYWRDTSVVDGVPVVSEQLFAEINYVAPLSSSHERMEHFRSSLTLAMGNALIKDMITKGYPLN